MPRSRRSSSFIYLLLVHDTRPVAKEFIDKLVLKTKSLKVGSPTEPDTIIGPLINRQALEQVKARVDEAVGRGARLLTGGKVQGSAYEPGRSALPLLRPARP